MTSILTEVLVTMTVILMAFTAAWEIYRDYWNMDDYDEHKISAESMANLSVPAYLKGARLKFFNTLRDMAAEEGLTVLINVTPGHFIHLIEEETSARIDRYIKRGNIDFLICSHEGVALAAVYYKLSRFDSTKNTERAVRHILKRMYIPVVKVTGKNYGKLARKALNAADY